MLFLLAALAAQAAKPTPSTSAAPAAPATADVVRAVETKYRDVDSLRARFVQVVHSDIYGDERQTGTMVLSRPDRLRWSFDESHKLFVSDGTALWIYTPADKQAMKMPSPKSQGASADLLLSLDKLTERFVVSVVQTSELAGHVLSLAPKGSDELFKELRLTLDPKLVVTNLRVVDPMGTVTDLQFSDVVLSGEPVPDSEFKFTPPPGVDVVSQ
jgi:chaperone LolA